MYKGHSKYFLLSGILASAVLVVLFLTHKPNSNASSNSIEAEKISERQNQINAPIDNQTGLIYSEKRQIDEHKLPEDMISTDRSPTNNRFPSPVVLLTPHTQGESMNWNKDFDPIAAGESAYNMRWASFVEQVELSVLEKQQVKKVLIAHEAHNMELGHLAQTGEFSRDAARKNMRTTDQLIKNLESLLSSDQIENLLESQRDNRTRFLRNMARSEDEAIENGYTGIVNFAVANDLPTVLAYIDSGSDVNTVTADGFTTPLLASIQHGNVEMVRALIIAGADVNLVAGNAEETPLRWAAWNGHTEIVNLLAAAGADLDYRSSEWSSGTALRDAAQNGHTETVAALLALGSDATGEAGISALAYAIRLEDTAMEQMLIDAGANENAPLVVGARALRRISRPLGYTNN